jgi:hypothetical protein
VHKVMFIVARYMIELCVLLKGAFYLWSQIYFILLKDSLFETAGQESHIV